MQVSEESSYSLDYIHETALAGFAQKISFFPDLSTKSSWKVLRCLLENPTGMERDDLVNAVFGIDESISAAGRESYRARLHSTLRFLRQRVAEVDVLVVVVDRLYYVVPYYGKFATKSAQMAIVEGIKTSPRVGVRSRFFEMNDAFSRFLGREWCKSEDD